MHFHLSNTVYSWHKLIGSQCLRLSQLCVRIPIIGADLSKHYKPDREVYLTAASLLELQPSQIMMVAAHQDDLRAARGVGFRTAFVPRPKEGPNGEKNNTPDAAWDVVVPDFNALAAALGA